MVHSPRASWPGAAAGTAEERVRSPRDQPKPLAVQSAPRRRDAGARELRASRSNRLAAALDCQAEMLHALRRRTGPTDQAVDGKLDTAVRTRCARHESSKSPRAVHCPGAVVPLSTHSASSDVRGWRRKGARAALSPDQCLPTSGLWAEARKGLGSAGALLRGPEEIGPHCRQLGGCAVRWLRWFQRRLAGNSLAAQVVALSACA